MAFIRIQLPFFLTVWAHYFVSTLQSTLQIYARMRRRSHSGVESDSCAHGPQCGRYLPLPMSRGGEKFAQFEFVFEFANIRRMRILKMTGLCWNSNSNSNIEIRIRFGEFEFESNPVSKIRQNSPRIRIRIMIVRDVIQHPVPGWMAREWQLIKAVRRRKYVSAQKRDSLISGDITNSSQSNRITVLERI
jgi:hypothetical protein